MGQRIKILQVVCIDGSNYGGVSALLSNIYSEIDHTKFAFDIAFPNKSTFGHVQYEFQKNNDAIYEFGIDIKTEIGRIRYTKTLKKFLKSCSYDIIHINSGQPIFNYLAAKAAKESTSAKIIVHNHNDVSRHKKRVVYPLITKLMWAYGDYYLSCSYKSAKEALPQKAFSENNYKTIINGIDLNKFRFDEQARSEIRKQYGISSDVTLIGSIGRLVDQKNYEFELNIFRRLVDKNGKNYMLFIVGQGNKESELKRLAKKLKVTDRIIWLPKSHEIGKILSAFDIFLLTSKFEGFGMVVVEAQTNGLPVLASDVLPEETKATDNIIYLSLDRPAQWVDLISKSKRLPIANRLTNYSIKNTTKEVTNIYESLLSDKKDKRSSV